MLVHHQRAQQKQNSSDQRVIDRIFLECDPECEIQARNKRIADALDIESPDLSSNLAVVYPDTVVRFAQDKPQLALMVETNLRRLSLQIDETAEKKLEYNLPSMNKKERQFVHELSDLFGIRSTGRDCEPHRFITLTAEKGKCTTPPNSLAKMLKISSAKYSSGILNRPMQLPSRRHIY